MSDDGGASVDTDLTRERDRVAVGIIATEDNSDGVARSILRAQQRGHEVFVTHYGDPDLEALTFAEQLGAEIVNPATDAVDREALYHELTATARASSFSGIILQSESCEPVDYATTLTDLEDGAFAVEASTTTPEDVGSTRTIAGIPAYNEASTIGEVVREVKTYVDIVLVVDDGSSDDTARIAQEAGARVIEHDRNRGYGAALKTLFREVDRRGPDHLVILDADGQHEPSDIPKLIEAQCDSDAEIVIGSRFLDDARTDAPLYRRFGIRVINAMTNLSLGVVRSQSRLSDTQSGFRVYDSRAIASLAVDETLGDRMSASTDILYHAHNRNYEIEEVGTTVHYDVEGASHHHPIAHGWALVKNILRTIETERPISAVGIPGFLGLLVGFGFAYWTITQYLRTGIFPRGLAIVSVFFALAGMFACFTAIILHALNQHFDTHR